MLGGDLRILGGLLPASVSDIQKQITDEQTQVAKNQVNLTDSQKGEIVRLSAQVAGADSLAASISSAKDAVNLGQSGLTQITSLLTQMKSLATRAGTGTLTESDRAALNTTYQSLLAQINSTVKNSKLDSMSMQVKSGLNGNEVIVLTNQNVDAAALGINSSDISTQTSASDVIDTLKAALDSISVSQSSLSSSKLALTTEERANQSMHDVYQTEMDTINQPDQNKLQMHLQQLSSQLSVNYYLISQMNNEAASFLSIAKG